MNNKPIGVIDTGLGGLSILQSLKQELPQENFVYLADQKYFPYSNLSKIQINRRITQIIAFLNSKSVKAIVIACNTITTSSIKLLRRLYPYFPFTGTEPAIKVAIDQNIKENIIVLSTFTTAGSKSFKDLVTKLDQKGQVKAYPCSDLIEAIEIADKSKINQLLIKHLGKIKSNYSAIVLGCTHFILIKDLIKEKLKTHVLIIEPSLAIATQTRKVLTTNKILSDLPLHDRVCQYLTTGDPDTASTSATSLLKQSIIFNKCNI
jgi:glutamate racemase